MMHPACSGATRASVGAIRAKYALAFARIHAILLYR